MIWSVSAHCFFCGNIVGAEGCSLCGTVRDARDERRVRAPCPRCASEARLVPFGLGDAALQACPRCKGMFVSAVDWDTLLDVFAREPLPDILVPDAEGPSIYGPYRSPPSSKNPVQVDLEADVRCPTCRGVMERLEFAAMTHVIIDVCAMHGVWLDAGELERIIDSVRPHTQLPPTPIVTTVSRETAYTTVFMPPTPPTLVEAAREPLSTLTSAEQATFVLPDVPRREPRERDVPWTTQLGRALGHLVSMLARRKHP